MKKIAWTLLICLLVLFFMCITVQAEEISEQYYQSSGLQRALDSLDPKVKGTLESWGLDPKTVFSGKGFEVKDVWQTVTAILTDCVKNPLTAFASTVVVVLLCALTHALVNESVQMNRMIDYFGAACMGVVWLVPAGELLFKVSAALTAVGQFMIVFIPLFAAILIRAGKPLTAGGTGALVFGCSQFMVYLSRQLLVPVMAMFLALSFCSTMSVGVKMDGIVSVFKKTAVWVLGISATVFSALLGITGVINGAGDSVAQRTTRFFIGNMVPVIGGALSESLATLQTCFGLLKTAGGVLGIGVVFVLGLPVLTELLLWRLSATLLVSISEWLETGELTRVLQAVGDTIGLLLAITIWCLVVFVVCMAVMASVG